MWYVLTPYPLSYFIFIFTHLKLWLATATHNFKRVRITHVCKIFVKFLTKHFLIWMINPFKPFQTWLYIVIFIHYKPRIAVAILDL